MEPASAGFFLVSCVTNYNGVLYNLNQLGGVMARGIYKIINLINNKFYVGSAEIFARRKRIHWWRLRRGDHSNAKLQAAWNKYGEASFIFVVVEECSDDVDILAAENVWLKEHVGKEYCYNIATDATAPTKGWVGEKNPMYGKRFSHTEEAKQKISVASKARAQTDEEKAKRIKTMQGHQVLPSTRAKLSATLSGEGNYWFGKERPDHGDKVSKSVIYTDIKGNETEYKSILALREDKNLKPPTVNRALKSGKAMTRGPHKGSTIRYK